MKDVWAAVATHPDRVSLLPTVLESLRPQVDRLCVYLNGHDSIPESVTRLADNWVWAGENDGDIAKAHWASRCDGLYLTCDDDIRYSPDYVQIMRHEIDRWQGRALVTLHGRIIKDHPKLEGVKLAPWAAKMITGGGPRFLQAQSWLFGACNDEGRWVNEGGTGLMGWDTSVLKVPSKWERSGLDTQLAIWAQEHKVPIWLAPHRGECEQLVRKSVFSAVDPNRGATKRGYIEGRNSWVIHSLGGPGE
jgi:hypothetical protein